MQGDNKVIEHLNDILAGELTAIDQYFIHSRMYEDFGLFRLYQKTLHEEQEERQHATLLIQRILFLEGTPDLSKRIPTINVGTDVPSMLNNDLQLEYQVIHHLREVMAYCESVKDFQTRQMLQVMLGDTEEDHAYWLEQQLGLIEKVGLELYTQAQIGEEAPNPGLDDCPF